MFVLDKNNKVEEAMSLWTQMQEEDNQPSDEFMWSLSELLKNNNLEVPFTVNKPKANVKSSIPSNSNNQLISQLELSVTNNNIAQALELRKNIHSKNLTMNPTLESKVIELLVRNDKLNDAMKIVKDMLETGRPISKNILYFLSGKLTQAGDIASLQYLNKKVSKV